MSRAVGQNMFLCIHMRCSKCSLVMCSFLFFRRSSTWSWIYAPYHMCRMSRISPEHIPWHPSELARPGWAKASLNKFIAHGTILPRAIPKDLLALVLLVLVRRCCPLWSNLQLKHVIILVEATSLSHLCSETRVRWSHQLTWRTQEELANAPLACWGYCERTWVRHPTPCANTAFQPVRIVVWRLLTIYPWHTPCRFLYPCLEKQTRAIGTHSCRRAVLLQIESLKLPKEQNGNRMATITYLSIVKGRFASDCHIQGSKHS